MAHLTLAGVSDDGSRLLLVSDKGVEFTLEIDARLRAALRGDDARLGQLEIKMESALRPRDIQARIRGGESPEAVARAAQTTVDRIMPYAAPVIAERQHVAERAQRSSVRRRGGDAGGARTLGDVVALHLRSLNVDPTTVSWDAWRREDGRWSLTADFSVGSGADSGADARTGQACFTFDPPGNYVVAEDDDARWLLGEQSGSGAPGPSGAAAPGDRDDLSQARERRRAAGPAEELPLGDDALELVHDSAGLGTEQPVEAYLDDEQATAEQARVEVSDPSHDESSEADEAAGSSEADEPSEAPEPPRRAAKKKGRSSVPSWDEIMFGGPGGSDRA